MQVLVKLLQNVPNKTYHPIFYRLSPLPGNTNTILRFKSIGHHTEGFKSRDEALADIVSENNNLRFKQMGWKPLFKTDDDVLWDGEGVPTDVQILNSLTA